MDKMSNEAMIADLEELRRFIQAFRAYLGELGDSVSRIESHFRDLGETWRDQEYDRLREEWEGTSRAILHYLNRGEDYTAYLDAKAEKIREFLEAGRGYL
jgi:hypothetical protein